MNTLKLLFTLSILFLFQKNLSASHLIGAELTYEHLDGNNYRINLIIYRDCGGTGADLDDNSWVIAYDNNNSFVMSHILPLDSSSIADFEGDECTVYPEGTCLEVGYYSKEVIIFDRAGGIKLAYHRYSRPSSDNLTESQGTMVYTEIPEVAVHGNNNSATFDLFPQSAICVNLANSIDLSATDIDGDSLSYELYHPYTAGGEGNAVPLPLSFVKTPVNYSGTYTFDTPIPNNDLKLDPVTGILDIEPSALGFYVAGVKINEYRDGVLINTVLRDFSYIVANCQSETLSLAESDQNGISQDIICTDYTVEFFKSLGSDLDQYVYYSYQCLATGDTTLDSVLMEANELRISIDLNALDLTNDCEQCVVQLTNDNACLFGEGPTDTINVARYPDIEAEFTTLPEQECDILVNIESEVTGGDGNYSYEWSTGSTEQIMEITADSRKTYTLTITDNCEATPLEIEYEVIPDCEVGIPSLLTPYNPDQINDYFVIDNIESYPNNQLLVFNRWGNTVYESENYQNDWNGVNQNGQLLKTGVYFYSFESDAGSFRGTLNIVK